MLKTKFKTNKRLIYLSTILFLILLPFIASDADLSIEKDIKLRLESTNYSLNNNIAGLWEVYFNTTPKSGTLKLEILTPQNIAFKNIFFKSGNSFTSYYLNNYSSNVYVTSWDGASFNNGGKINFDILSPGYFLINLSFGNDSVIVQNKNYYEQEGYSLDLDNPLFRFDLCFFNNSFSICNPTKSTDTGFYGQKVFINSSGLAVNTLLIPKNSTLINVNMTLSPAFDKEVLSYSGINSMYSDFDLCSIGNENTLLLTSGTYLSSYINHVNLTNSNLLNQLSLSSRIDSVACGELNTTTTNKEVVIAGEGYLKIYSNNVSTLLKSKTDSQIYKKVFVGKIENDYQTEYKNDSNTPKNFFRINNGSYYEYHTFALPTINVVNKKCFVSTAINYAGDKQPLNMRLDNVNYPVAISNIFFDDKSIFMSTLNEEIKGFECVGCKNSTLTIKTIGDLQPKLEGVNCTLYLPLVYQGSVEKNITLSLVNPEGVISTQNLSSALVSSFNNTFFPNPGNSNSSVVISNSSSYLFSTNFDFSSQNYSSNDTCEIISGFTYKNQKKDMSFSINSKDYTIPKESIIKRTDVLLKNSEDIGTDILCVGCDESKSQLINLSRIKQGKNISGTDCFLNLSFNYYHAKDKTLSIDIGTDNYNIDTNVIDESSQKFYNLTNTSSPDFSNLNSSINGEAGTMLLFRFDNVFSKPLVGQRCVLHTKVCYNGVSPVGDINLNFLNGGSALLDTLNASNCNDSTINDLSVDIDCSKFYGNGIQFSSAPGSNYSFAVNNQSSMNNSYHFREGPCNGGCLINGDYSLFVEQEGSYLYSSVQTKVSCDVLNTNDYANVSCTTCNSSDVHYNLILDSNNNTISSMSTNSSLDFSMVNFFVPCIDLVNQNSFELKCPDCSLSNSYSLIKDNNSNPYVYIRKAQTNIQNSEVVFDCKDFSNNPSINLKCDSCNNLENFQLGYINSSKGQMSINESGINYSYLSKDAAYSLYTNNSLEHNFVQTEINCSNVQNSNIINYSCPTCNFINYYNFLLENLTYGNSFVFNGSEQPVNSFDFMNRFIFVDQNAPDDIIVFDTDNVLYMYDPTFRLINSINFNKQIYSVYVDDYLTDYLGNEILVGVRDSTNLYNSTGGLIYTFPYSGTAVTISRIVDNKVILIGTNDGSLYLCNNDICEKKYQVSTQIKDIAVGDFTQKPNNEIAVLENLNLTILDSEFNKITSISADAGNYFMKIKNKDTDVTVSLEELFVLSSTGLKKYNFFIPENINITLDNILINNYSSKLNQDIFFQLNKSVLQDYLLNNCSSDFCAVPITFKSIFNNFFFNVKNVNVLFDYGINVSYDDNVNILSKTTNMNSDDLINYQALKIIYNNIPLMPIYIREIQKVEPFLNFSKNYFFNTVLCTADGVKGVLGYTSPNSSITNCGKDYYISSLNLKEPDYLWYNEEKINPVVITRNSYSSGLGNIMDVNITLNNTLVNQTLRNVTINLNINEAGDTQKDPLFLQVDLYSNGNYYDIPVPQQSTQCNGPSPIYNTTIVLNTTISLCIQDVTDNGITDFIRILQPIITDKNHEFGNITYRITSFSNQAPSLDHVSYAPSSTRIGEQRNFTIGITDPDPLDVISARLWIYSEFEGVWKNITDMVVSSTINITIPVNITKNLVGAVKYRFDFCDYYDENCYHTNQTSIFNMNAILKNDINISKIDVSNSNELKVLINSSLTHLPLYNESLTCQFYINTVFLKSTVSDSLGYCSYTPPTSYEGSTINWSVNVISNSYYNSNSFSDTNKRLYRFLHPSLMLNSSFKRNNAINFTARIKDMDDNNISVQNIQCYFEIKKGQTQVINDTLTTNSNGICQFNWANDCTNDVGDYDVLINISGGDSFTLFTNTTSSVKFDIRDSLTLNILPPYDVSPQNASQGEAVNLKSIANDTCGGLINYSSIYWKDQKDVMYSGQNITYNVPSNALGGIMLDLISTSTYYSTTNDSIYLYLGDSVKIKMLQKLDQNVAGNYVLIRGNNTPQIVQAQILTGNDIPLTIANYAGNYSGHKCDWGIKNKSTSNFDYITSTYTNNLGICNFTYPINNCAYSPSILDISVNLTVNRSTFDFDYYTPESNFDFNSFKLIDENVTINASTSLWQDPLSTHNFYYTDIFNVNFTVKDTCGVSNISNQVLFKINTINTSNYIASGDNIAGTYLGPVSITPNGLTWSDTISQFYGPANYTGNMFYNNGSGRVVNMTIYRSVKVAGISTNASQIEQGIILNNTYYKMFCDIVLTDTTGAKIDIQQDQSKILTNFYFDNNKLGSGFTNTAGRSNYSFISTSPGFHQLRCEVISNLSRYLNMTSPSFGNLSMSVELPSNYSVKDVIINNRVLNTNPGSPNYGNFYVDSDTVFRAQSLLEEPLVMYMAGSPGINDSGNNVWIYQDEITINFTIVNATDRLGTGGTPELGQVVDYANCTVNLTAYNNRGSKVPQEWLPNENVVDNFYDRSCLAKWRPKTTLPVGYYFVIPIMSKKGVPGTVSAAPVKIRVKGILNVKLTTPNREAYPVAKSLYNGYTFGSYNPALVTSFVANQAYTLTSDLIDDAGTHLPGNDPSIVQTVDYGYNIWHWCGLWYDLGNGDTTTNNNLYVNWSNYDLPGRNGIWNYHYPGNEFTVKASIANPKWYSDGSLMTQKYYYTPYCDAEYFTRPNYDISFFNLKYEFSTELITPSETTVCLNGNPYVNVSCLAKRSYDDRALWSTFQIKLKCENCINQTSNPFNQNPVTKNIDSLSKAVAMFKMDLENLGAGHNEYNYSCEVYDTDISTFNHYITVPPSNKIIKTVNVYKFCGTGQGACDYNGVCDDGDGESCSSCPNDCGYDNLPNEFAFDSSGNPVSKSTLSCGNNKDLSCQVTYETKASAPDDCSNMPAPPTMNIFLPEKSGVTLPLANAKYYANSNFDIHYKVTDINSNLRDINFYLDTAPLGSNPYASYAVPPPGTKTVDSYLNNQNPGTAGLHVYKFEAYDHSSFNAVKEFNLYYDTTNPTSPNYEFDKAPPKYANGTDVGLYVNVSDNSGVIGTVKYYNGVDSAVTASLDSGKGMYYATVKANTNQIVYVNITDKAGNLITTSYTYINILTPPAINSLSLNTNLSQNSTLTKTIPIYVLTYNNGTNSQIKIDYTITDNPYNLSESYILIEGDATKYCDKNYTNVPTYTATCFLNLSDSYGGADGWYGTKYVKLWAWNAVLGNSSNVTLYIDNIKPNVTLTYPNATYYTNESGSKLAINATVTKSTGYAGLLTPKVNGSDMTLVSGGNYTFNYSIPMSDGVYTNYVVANDWLYNSRNVSITVVVDKIPPVINITLPINDTYIYQLINISLNVSETIKYDSSKIIFGSDSTCSDYNASKQINITSENFDTILNVSYILDRGDYYVCAVAFDLAGNMGTSSKRIRLDSLPPTTYFIDPTLNQSIVDKASYIMNITIESAFMDNTSVKMCVSLNNSCTPNISMNHQYTTGTNYSFTKNYSGFDSDGVWTIRVYSNSTFGANSISSSTFKIDNYPPDINYLYPGTGSALSNSVNLTFSVDDLAGNGNSSTYKYKFGNQTITNLILDSAPNYTASINTSLRNDNQSDVIIIFANDTKGHSSNVTFNLFIDNNDPVISQIYLNNPAVNSKLPFFVNVTVLDSPAPTTLKNCTAYLSNDTTFDVSDTYLGNLSNDCTGFLVTNSSLPYNISYLFIKVFDLTSHSNINYTNITIDNTPPQIDDYKIFEGVNEITDSGTPTSNFTFIVNASDPSGMNRAILSVSDALGDNLQKSNSTILTFQNIDNHTFILNSTPEDFHAVYGLYDFNVTVFDNANNSFMTNKTLLINPSAISIKNFMINSSPPFEVNAKDGNFVLFLINFTGVPTVTFNLTINHTDISASDQLSFNYTQDCSLNQTTLAYTCYYNFTPLKEGNYNATLYLANMYASATSNLNFTAIGKTDGTISITNLNPIILTNITKDNSPTLNFSINATNIGPVKMYSSTVIVPELNGMISNLVNEELCYDIHNNSISCMKNLNMTITQRTGHGLKIIYTLFKWINPDDTVVTMINSSVINISPNDYLKAVNLDINHDAIIRTNTSIGNITLQSYGNTILNNITLNDSSSKGISFSLQNLSTLEVDKDQTVTVYVYQTIVGQVIGNITVQVRNNTCEYQNQCKVVIPVNISVYDYMNLSNMVTDNSLNRSFSNNEYVIYCKVKSLIAGGGNLQNINTSFLVDSTNLGSSLTSASGFSNITLDMSTVSVGPHNLTCKVDPQGYYRIDQGTKSKQVDFYGNLSSIVVNRSVNTGDIYWYDNHPVYYTNLSIQVKDEFGVLVNNSLVLIYSNSTQSGSWSYVGNCTTNNGQCIFSLNPNVSSPGNYSYYATASKEYYYNGTSTNYSLNVIGGLSVYISSPIESSTVYQQQNITLNATIFDDNGQDITKILEYNYTWILLNQNDSVNTTLKAVSQNTIGYPINYTWNINNSFLGYQKVALNVSTSGLDKFEKVNITIFRNDLKVSQNVSSTPIIYKDENDTSPVSSSYLYNLSVQINDSDSYLSNVNVTFYYNNYSNLIESILTDSSGYANLSWNPNSTVPAGNTSIFIKAQKQFYNELSQKISNFSLIGIPKITWESAEKINFALNLNITEPLNLSCLVSDYKNDLAIKDYNVSVYLLKPTNLKTDTFTAEQKTLHDANDGYNISSISWTLDNANGALNIVGTQLNMTIYPSSTFTIKLTGLNLSGFDEFSANFENNNALNLNFTLIAFNGSVYSFTTTNTENLSAKNITGLFIEKIYISIPNPSGTNNEVLINNLVFAKKTYDIFTNLGYDKTYFDSGPYPGSFENVSVNGFISPSKTYGWASVPSNALSKTSQTLFGTAAAELNFTNLLENKSVELNWSYTGNYDISSYKTINLFVKTNISMELSFGLKDSLGNLKYIKGKQEIKNATWTFISFDISEFNTVNSSKINGLFINLTNKNTQQLNGTVLIDEIYLTKQLKTDINGNARFIYTPTDAEKIAIGCQIQNVTYFKTSNITPSFITRIVNIINSAASPSTPSTDESLGGAASQDDNYRVGGAVTSFKISPESLNLFVPINSTDTFKAFEIQSLIRDTLSINVSINSPTLSINNPRDTSNSTNFSLRNKEIKSITLYLNTSNITLLEYNPKKEYIIFTSEKTKEKLIIEINIYAVDLYTNITIPSISSIITNIKEDDNLNFLLNITYNKSTNNSIIGQITNKVYVEEKECQYESQTITNNNFTNITCKAPLPERNPITPLLKIEIDTSTIVSNDSTTLYAGKKEIYANGLLTYIDVTGPFFEWVNITTGYINYTRNVTTNVTDNIAVNKVLYQIKNYKDKKVQNTFKNSNTEISINLTTNTSSKNETLFTLLPNITLTNASFKITGNENNTQTGLIIKIQNTTLLNYPSELGKITKFENNGNEYYSKLIKESESLQITIPANSKVTSISLNITPINNSQTSLIDPSSIFVNDKNIYILDKTPAIIYILNKDLTYNSSVGYNDSITGLNQPSRIIVDNNTIYLTDTNNHKLIKIELSSNTTTKSTTIPQSIGMSYPEGLSTAYNGQIFVSDTNNKRILVYNITSKQLINTINETENITINYPSDIEQFQNQVYIVEPSYDRVRIYNYTNNTLIFVKNLSDKNLDNYNLSSPQDIHVSTSKIIVADTKNGKVRVYNKDYSTNQTITLSTSEQPTAVFLENNTLYVLDKIKKQLITFNMNSTGFVRDKNLTMINKTFYPENIVIDIGNDAYYNILDKIQNAEYQNQNIIINSTTITSTVLKDGIQTKIDLCENEKEIYKVKHCIIDTGIRYRGLGEFNLSILIEYSFEKTFDITNTLNNLVSSSSNKDINISVTCGNNCSLKLSYPKLEYYDNNESSTLQNNSNIYTVLLPQILESGLYQLLLKANDTLGHNSYNNKLFENHNSTIFLNNFMLDKNDDFSVDLKFYRTNESPTDLLNEISLTDPTKDVNITIQEMPYNLNLEVSYLSKNNPMISDYHTVKLDFSNIEFVKTFNNLTNETIINNSIQIKTIDFETINFPNYSKEYNSFGKMLSGGLSIITNATFKNLTITFNYSIIKTFIEGQNEIFTPSNLRIFKCAYHNVSNCSSDDWIMINTSIDETAMIAYGQSNSTSTYILLELNTTNTDQNINEKIDEKPQQSTSTSSQKQTASTVQQISGSIGQTTGRLGICGDNYCDSSLGENKYTCPLDCSPTVQFILSCGNNVCEIGENPENCPQDCENLPFEIIETNIDQINIFPQKNKEITVEIKNLLNNAIPLELSTTPLELNQYFEKLNTKTTLQSYEIIKINVNLTIKDYNFTKLYGELKISSDNKQKIVPININILDPSKNYLSIKLKLKSDKIYFENKPELSIDISNPLELKEKTEFRISVIDLNTKKEAYAENIPINLDTKTITLEKILNSNLEKGNYLLQIKNNEFNSEASTYFTIEKPFWTQKRLNLLIIGIIGYTLMVLIVIGVVKYRKYKFEKIRYLLPNLKLIPQMSLDAFEIGHIAGKDKIKAYYNPNDLTTHTLVSGSTGSGKSVSASILVEEALLHNIAVVIFDPTAQWTGFLKPCTDQNLLKFYKLFNLNENDARGFKGLIYNVETPNIELNFKDYMNPGEVTIFNLNQLGPGEYDIAVQNIISEMFKIKWEESPELKLLVVFDEVHRLLEKYGGSGGYVALEKACREFRKWGIGMVMASQVSTDFKDAIQGNILTEIQLNTKNLEDIKKIGEKYGQDYSKRITRQGIGVGLLQNPKYNDGKPWFVQFRPTLHNPHKITEIELKTYTEYSQKIKDLEKVINKLKIINKSTSDIELELKMAKNKLKEGHFKMTQMYIDSIESTLKNL